MIGYVVCFEGVFGMVVWCEKVEFGDVLIDVKVMFGLIEDCGFGIGVWFDVMLFDVSDAELVKWIVVGVYEVCLYFNVMCGNIDVVFIVNG